LIAEAAPLALFGQQAFAFGDVLQLVRVLFEGVDTASFVDDRHSYGKQIAIVAVPPASVLILPTIPCRSPL
jgi:hypothetical protein